MPLHARSYTLRLPAGSRYHPLAGRLGQEQSVQLGGLRTFRLPFRTFATAEDSNQPVYDATT